MQKRHQKPTRILALRNRHVTTMVSVFAIIALLTGIAAPLQAQAQSSQDGSIYELQLTNKTNNGQPDSTPMTVFDCSDRIHLVVIGKNLPTKQHELMVRWKNPLGEQQELTRFKFQGAPYSRTWAWLQLHGPTAAAIGQIFDPSFGMDDFIGQWVASVYIDKNAIGEIKFEVLC